MGYREHFILAMAFTGISTLILGLFVLFRNIKNKIYVIFSLYSFSIAWWSLAQIGTVYGPTLESSWFWSRLEHIGVAFIPTFFLNFVILFLDLKNRRWLLVVSYILTIILSLTIPLKLLVSNVSHKLGGIINYGNPGPFYTPLVIFFIISVSYGLWELFIAYNNSTGLRRNQLKYLCCSSLFGYMGGAANFSLIYDINIPVLNPFGTYLVGLYALVFAYAILKYRLMDINIALTRAGIFVVVYTLVLGFPFWFGVKTGLWVYSTVIMAVLATAGPFIYLAIQRRVEKRLRKEQLEYQRRLRDASSTMMLSKDLDTLLKVIVLNAADIVKVKWAGVYLKDDKQSNYLLKHCLPRQAKIYLPKEITDDSDFVKRLFKSRLPLIGEELLPQKLKVGLSVPCFLDNNLIAFLLLGDKPNDKLYDQSDINEFTLLANQAALAIENCRFYSQERQHQHYLRVSSLDRQMAGLAHEIDNPNSALLGSLGSLELALDDLKDVIPEDKIEAFLNSA